jgi:hypothetical protein
MNTRYQNDNQILPNFQKLDFQLPVLILLRLLQKSPIAFHTIPFPADNVFHFPSIFTFDLCQRACLGQPIYAGPFDEPSE